MLRRTIVTSAVLVSALIACESKAPGNGGGAPAPPTTAERAPNVFRARFETSKGPFVIQVNRAWAPQGADRFYSLVKSGYFDNNRFFRVVTSFMVQFGVHGDPAVNKAWEPLASPDDSVTQSNLRGYVTYAAMSAPNTRSTQVFINLIDNRNLDPMGFAPFGQVIEGMAVVDSLYAGYGDGPPMGFGPDQMRIMAEGNAYLEKAFPKLDFVRAARLVPDSAVA
ncbi:MAG: peptidylprolyl isomerase, partial [Cytophagaceae bacterium]|nr:peptidylprolyl isomerase [Gemmatimonadaceae bacterium]